ncbi:hypothetical protein [uncultured Desulfobacter sp.]|uniref:hypothetical protein n=1 Tax=uncultured Desulfobacter sp. TaxID=240139 RepID=UPI002AAC21BC|nr:hypothetical protein [uncultured Desulfobacter sp.]
MKNHEIQKKLFGIENEFDVGKLTYNGYKIWNFLRAKVIASLNSNTAFKECDIAFDKDIAIKDVLFQKKEYENEKKLCDSQKERFSNNNGKIKDKKITFIANSVYRSDTIDGGKFHKFADALGLFGPEINIMEYTMDYFRLPPYGNPTYISDIIKKSKYQESEKYLKDGLTGAIDRTEIKYYDEFLQFIESKKICLIQNENSLKRYLDYILFLRNNFKDLLLKFETKIMFCNIYWHEVESAAIQACRELSIKTIDMQHGFTGNDHVWYANRGKYVIQDHFTPDLFWVWGQRNQKMLSQWLDTRRVIDGGNIWLSYALEKYKTLSTPKQRNKKQFLFTIQPHDNCLPSELIEIIYETSEKFEWLFRYHPTHPNMIAFKDELFQKINQIDAKGIDLHVEYASQANLYDLLPEIDLHFTCHSTVAFEASAFDIPTVFISEDAPRRLGDCIDEQMFCLALKSSEIKTKIEWLLRNKPCNVKKPHESITKETAKIKSILLSLDQKKTNKRGILIT